MDTPGRGLSRLCLVAGLLLLVSAWLPLLMVRFTSPQYPTESPTLNIYAGEITGNAHEFQVLSHYVGIQFPPDVPELDSGVVTWVIASLGIIALISSIPLAEDPQASRPRSSSWPSSGSPPGVSSASTSAGTAWTPRRPCAWRSSRSPRHCSAG